MCIPVVLPADAFRPVATDIGKWPRQAVYFSLGIAIAGVAISLVAGEALSAFLQILLIVMCCTIIRAATPATFLIYCVLSGVDAFVTLIQFLELLPYLTFGDPPLILRQSGSFIMFALFRPASALLLAAASCWYCSALLKSCREVNFEISELLFQQPTCEASFPGPAHTLNPRIPVSCCSFVYDSFYILHMFQHFQNYRTYNKTPPSFLSSPEINVLAKPSIQNRRRTYFHTLIDGTISVFAVWGLQQLLSKIKNYFYSPLPNNIIPDRDVITERSSLNLVYNRSSLWMIDKQVNSPDEMTQLEAEERKKLIKDVIYDIVLWLKEGSCYTGETRIMFKWMGNAKQHCYLNFSGGVIESIQINRFVISKTGHPLMSDIFSQSRARFGYIKWQSHRLIISSELLIIGNNEMIVTYNCDYDLLGMGLIQLIDKTEQGVLESYVYSVFHGFEAHRAFPCFDQPDIKGIMRLRIATTLGTLALCTGIQYVCNVYLHDLARIVGTRIVPTHLYSHSTEDIHLCDDWEWEQLIHTLCHNEHDNYINMSSLLTLLQLDSSSKSSIITHPSFYYLDRLGYPSSHPSGTISQYLIWRGITAITGGSNSSILPDISHQLNSISKEFQCCFTKTDHSQNQPIVESPLLQMIPRTLYSISEFICMTPISPFQLELSSGPYHFREITFSSLGTSVFKVTLYYRKQLRRLFSSATIFSTIELGVHYFEFYFKTPFPAEDLHIIYLPGYRIRGIGYNHESLSYGHNIFILPESELDFSSKGPLQLIILSIILLLERISYSWILTSITFSWWQDIWWSNALSLYLAYLAIGHASFQSLITTLTWEPWDYSDVITYYTHIQLQGYSWDRNSYLTQPLCCSIPSMSITFPMGEFNRIKGSSILFEIASLIGHSLVRSSVLDFCSIQRPVSIQDFFARLKERLKLHSTKMNKTIYPIKFPMTSCIQRELISIGKHQLLHSHWLNGWLGRSGINRLFLKWETQRSEDHLSHPVITSCLLEQSNVSLNSLQYRVRRVRVDFIFKANDCIHSFHLNEDIISSKTTRMISMDQALVPLKEARPPDHNVSLKQYPLHTNNIYPILFRCQEYKTESYYVFITEQQTSLDLFIGISPSPEAILLNSDNSTYATVRYDPKTMLFIFKNLSLFQNTCIRLSIWINLQHMVEDTLFSPYEYLNLFRHHILYEKNGIVLCAIISTTIKCLQRYITDTNFFIQCRQLQDIARLGERCCCTNRTDMKIVWQTFLATISYDPEAICQLLKRMDEEDGSMNEFKQTYFYNLKTFHFEWDLNNNYWRHDGSKPYSIVSNDPCLETSVSLVKKKSKHYLSRNVRWIILENYWALYIPDTEPERTFWIEERKRRLQDEIHFGTYYVSTRHYSLRCYAASLIPMTMEHCWKQFLHISPVTDQTLMAMMNAFNRRRLCEQYYIKLTKIDKAIDLIETFWWGLTGFYKDGVIKQAIQKCVQEKMTNLHPSNNYMSFDVQTKQSLLRILIPKSVLHYTQDIIEYYDKKFFQDIPIRIQTQERSISKKLWFQLFPMTRPTQSIKNALEQLISIQNTTPLHSTSTLRRVANASLETYLKVIQSRDTYTNI